MSKKFADVFMKFIKNPNLQGTFGNLVYQHFYLIDKHALITNKNQTLIGIKIPSHFANMIGSVHVEFFFKLANKDKFLKK